MSEIYIKNDVESLDLEEQGVNRTSNPINMCDINAINSDNNLEIENKIDVEEGILGLDCLKKELVDDDHDQPLQDTEMNENDYKINIQEVLMDTYDTEIKNEETVVKSENIKQECVFDIQVGLVAGSVDNIYCDLCGKDYAGYCSRCSSLSHCLSNNVSSTDPEWNTKTIPTNILEIKLVNDRSGVFAVRTIPKSVILGPFEGVLPIESTTGNMWKMKDKKLVNAENGNWMQHVCSTGNALFKNLDTFQFGGYLYYQTTREVNESDELLVCYREEEMQKSDNSEECYYIPIKLEQSQKVFACTLCCLGFRLEKCLTEHKSKCPHAEHNKAVEEIIECRTCNIWLEKQEYEEHHQVYCSEIYPRFTGYPAANNGTKIKDEAMDGALNELNRIGTDPIEMVDMNMFSDQNNHKTKQEYSFENKVMKCNREIADKSGKLFKCPQCSYESNRKGCLKRHLNTHNKPFLCGICMSKFARKIYLEEHMKNKHGDTEKDHKCSICSYQTNHLSNFKIHLNSHTKPFQCHICMSKFSEERYLKIHVKDKHAETGTEKDHKCLLCPYQTNYKINLQNHLNTHNDLKPSQRSQKFKGLNLMNHMKVIETNGTKKFKCNICMLEFGFKHNLKTHIKNKHAESGTEKDHKCPQCSYQTNHKTNIQNHLRTHDNLEPYQCTICLQKFKIKCNLGRHMKRRHAKDAEKEYKCSECSFETYYKESLKRHQLIHGQSEEFQCFTCLKKFTQERYLTTHLKKQH